MAHRQNSLNSVIWNKHFLTFLFYLVIAVVFIPYIGTKLPFSMYYHSEPESDLHIVLQENSIRVSEAQRTLKVLSRSKTDYHKLLNSTRRDIEFCFVVLSVSRPANVHYLTQVVAALLPQISNSNSVFTVLNGEGPTHTEARNLSAIVPVVTAIDDSKLTSKYAKEKEDYVHALEWCQKKRSRFSVILQDDALPPEDFMDRLKFVLRFRMTNEKNWAFLKLYYPEKWEGWANENRIISELIVATISGGIIFSAVICAFQIVIMRALPRKIELFGLVTLFTLSSIFTLYILLTLGRPHWLSLRKFSPQLSSVVPAPGCCIPGMVYPQTHLPDLIDYLRRAKCSASFPVDLALDRFAKNKDLDGLLVIPNMVKHIGFLSSLGKGWRRKPEEFII